MRLSILRALSGKQGTVQLYVKVSRLRRGQTNGPASHHGSSTRRPSAIWEGGGLFFPPSAPGPTEGGSISFEEARAPQLLGGGVKAQMRRRYVPLNRSGNLKLLALTCIARIVVPEHAVQSLVGELSPNRNSNCRTARRLYLWWSVLSVTLSLVVMSESQKKCSYANTNNQPRKFVMLH